jgi:hypothetical protein
MINLAAQAAKFGYRWQEMGERFIFGWILGLELHHDSSICNEKKVADVWVN